MNLPGRVIAIRSATVIIAVVTALVSTALLIAGRLDEAAAGLAFIPARASGLIELTPALPVFLTPFSAALVHGGFLHLITNLIMLCWVGSRVERVLGAGSLVVAYLVGAVVAAAAQWVAGPSDLSPMVGASGAISALFGIYALLAGQPRQVTRSASVNRAIHVAWLLAAWIVIQWMTAEIAGGQGVMLATPAHIGGFIAGVALERPLLLWRYRSA